MKTVDKITWAAVIAVALIGVFVVAGLERSRRTALAARAVVEPWREMPDWHGTKVGGLPGVPKPVLTAFERDPPAPEDRKTTFAFALYPGTQYPCIGWYAAIDAVTPNADGWEVVVKVSGHLKSLRGGVPFSTTSTTEKWQVSERVPARFLKCISATQGFVMTD